LVRKCIEKYPNFFISYSELELPNYESREALENKLRFAISEGKEGFHIA